MIQKVDLKLAKTLMDLYSYDDLNNIDPTKYEVIGFGLIAELRPAGATHYLSVASNIQPILHAPSVRERIGLKARPSGWKITKLDRPPEPGETYIYGDRVPVMDATTTPNVMRRGGTRTNNNAFQDCIAVTVEPLYD